MEIDKDAAEWFESCVLPHERAAVRLLLRLCNDRDDLEDLLQQSYVKVLGEGLLANRRGGGSSASACEVMRSI